MKISLSFDIEKPADEQKCEEMFHAEQFIELISDIVKMSPENSRERMYIVNLIKQADLMQFFPELEEKPSET